MRAGGVSEPPDLPAGDWHPDLRGGMFLGHQLRCIDPACHFRYEHYHKGTRILYEAPLCERPTRPAPVKNLLDTSVDSWEDT